MTRYVLTGGIISKTTLHTCIFIQKAVVFNAPIEHVWKAVATSEGIASWWMPNTFEPILGRDFILHAGQFGDSPCKVTEIDPLNCVGFDWGKDWHLTFELKKLEDGKTELTLIHSGWDAEKVTEFGQPHSVVHGIMDSGWEKIIKENLPIYIEA
ncbi:SRPBCC domain-containing protein [Fodinisporobacter ferrooxydans]|uniref:SRPBCC domain-containing protein n=1 Tax=Fodinisporobacter ferrooxydans TaxID=2901836 RepID=A0ABY4CMF3_9BACL|nr:SRPBCC domain-containing protein [Alicyclobacillaceae bacterium MYW30-H2]